MEDPVLEGERYKAAREKTAAELEKLKADTERDLGKAEAMIFEIHRMMLYDDDFDRSVISMIKWQSVNAEYAVMATAESLAEDFTSMPGDYMKARAADIRDVAKRLMDALSNRDPGFGITSPVIIAADDLAPGETVGLDRDLVLGFITEKGSDNSHSAILARTMGIPAVVSASGIDPAFDGKHCVLDGDEGILYVEPDGDTLVDLRNRMAEHEKERKRLKRAAERLAVTGDGRRIKVFSNIGDVSDAGYSLKNGAEGIGLFRSEFLYMKYGRLPTEDEQFEAYRGVAKAMDGREVTVRTLDVGADKRIPYLEMKTETNPALGVRGIRYCLKERKLFLTQLRALLRAAAFGKISVMIPMVVSGEEIDLARELFQTAKDQLRSENVPYCENVPFGIMIETPAAAVMADVLAEKSDFFSIGTNDLTQYTGACDRENPEVGYLSDRVGESVLRLISHVARCGTEAGIPVGICGELGGDPKLIPFFIECGVSELSVSPSAVPRVKEAVMNFSGSGEKVPDRALK